MRYPNRYTLLPALLAFLLGVSFPCEGMEAASEQPLEFSSPAQKERFWELMEELRCLVCQNESLAASPAPLAQDLRQEVYGMMQAGKSKEEILSFLTDRYGDFILYRPPIKPVTYLLWFGPALLLLVGLTIAARIIYRREKVPEPPLSELEHVQAVRMLERDPHQDKQS